MVLGHGRVMWTGRYGDHPDGMSQEMIQSPQERVL